MDDSVDFVQIAEIVSQATDFISSALSSSNGVVLVHCRMGRSRSAAIALAYMMKFQGSNLN
jgi:protein-tyrosine phosphatase